MRRPRKIREALWGESAAPSSWWPLAKRVSITLASAMTAPPTTSLWPPMYFDKECTTMSMPWVIGFWNSGVAQVLSISVRMPCCLAVAEMASRSASSMRNDDGLSM